METAEILATLYKDMIDHEDVDVSNCHGDVVTLGRTSSHGNGSTVRQITGIIFDAV